MVLNETKINEFVGKMLVEMGAAVTGPLVLIGDKLGLYKALANGGPMSADELSRATDTAERYVSEWLASQAASGYIEYDSASRRFSMTPEQIAVFADADSPYLLTGAYYSLASTYLDEPKLAAAFRSGAGINWGDHNDSLFCGVAKFFRSSYHASLIKDWIPALSGVEKRLREGAVVADVGCGYGISTVLMARHYPQSTFYGFDIHEESIKEARALAAKEKLSNVSFAVTTAKKIPAHNYDLITYFDCLHDMGDPAGAARHVFSTLKEGGSWMIVEPFAHDRLEDNLTSLGRLYYGYSTQVCTPTSLSQEVGAALGAQAGERRLREVIEPAGFSRVRKAAETPFNIILEAIK